MPRQARKESSTGIYHVMVRGNEKKDLFHDNKDRERFLEILHAIKGNGSFNLYAYCLMSNHIHLLLKEGEDSLERTMKRICVSYVAYFNRKYDRIGHLFQDRFRSEAVAEDPYLLAVARYIHNNPVKAGIVKTTEGYPWSSYNDYMNKISTHELDGLVDRHFILSMLSDNENQARELLKRFTAVSSDERFVEYATERDSIPKKDESKLTENIQKVLDKYGYHAGDIKSGGDIGKRNALLKEIKNATGASVRELSKALGISKDIIFRA